MKTKKPTSKSRNEIRAELLENQLLDVIFGGKTRDFREDITDKVVETRDKSWMGKINDYLANIGATDCKHYLGFLKNLSVSEETVHQKDVFDEVQPKLEEWNRLNDTEDILFHFSLGNAFYKRMVDYIEQRFSEEVVCQRYVFYREDYKFPVACRKEFFEDTKTRLSDIIGRKSSGLVSDIVAPFYKKYEPTVTQIGLTFGTDVSEVKKRIIERVRQNGQLTIQDIAREHGFGYEPTFKEIIQDLGMTDDEAKESIKRAMIGLIERNGQTDVHEITKYLGFVQSKPNTDVVRGKVRFNYESWGLERSYGEKNKLIFSLKK